MKKIISLVLVFILMLSVAIMPAFAESIQFPTEGQEWLFFEQFDEQYTDTYGYNSILARDVYKEECYHYNKDGNIDWALLECMLMVIDESHYAVFGDMIYVGYWHMPFYAYYGLYDVEQSKVINLTDLDDLSEYDGLKDYLYSIDYIQPIGDFDLDKKLTILDATGIQLAEAEILEYHESNDLQGEFYDFMIRNDNIKEDNDLRYLTDFDRDGERTVLDATAIQYKLAGLEY